MNLTPEEAERRQIRDAKDRLLAGDPMRSDGQLIVKSLAVEYGHVNLLQSERYGRRVYAGMGDVLEEHAHMAHRLDDGYEELVAGDAVPDTGPAVSAPRPAARDQGRP